MTEVVYLTFLAHVKTWTHKQFMNSLYKGLTNAIYKQKMRSDLDMYIVCTIK